MAREDQAGTEAGVTRTTSSTDAVYVLPVRWAQARDPAETTAYLRTIAEVMDVVVVDSSPGPVFAQNHAAWHDVVRHVRAAEHPPGTNGKVANVLAGLATTAHELVVVADDDVRYSPAALRAVLERWASSEVVRPQNYFTELPWHARWDTARTLLNRALGADYPGTLAVRRSAVPGGYASDVLFENLELLRTVRAAGGRQDVASDVFVARRPCGTRTFVSQRVRQAYDSQAQPLRLVAELAVVPALVSASARGGRSVGLGLGVLVVGAVALAEVGRRRHEGTRVFPASCSLWAPLWVLERGVCSWLALALRVRGGVPYAGGRIRRAAHSERALRGPGGRHPGTSIIRPQTLDR